MWFVVALSYHWINSIHHFAMASDWEAELKHKRRNKIMQRAPNDAREDHRLMIILFGLLNDYILIILAMY